MLFQVDVAIRQQEPPRRHGFLHIGAFGAIEMIVLGDKPGMAYMVTELHTVCVDDIQVGAIRYAREAYQKHLIEPVPIVPDRYAFPGQQRERFPQHPRQFFTLPVDAVFPGVFNGLDRDQSLFTRRKLAPIVVKNDNPTELLSTCRVAFQLLHLFSDVFCHFRSPTYGRPLELNKGG